MDGPSNSHEDIVGASTYHDKEPKSENKDIVTNYHSPCKRNFDCAPKKVGEIWLPEEVGYGIYIHKIITLQYNYQAYKIYIEHN